MTLFVYLIEGSGMNAQLMLILAMIVAAAAGIIYSFMLAFAAGMGTYEGGIKPAQLGTAMDIAHSCGYTSLR